MFLCMTFCLVQQANAQKSKAMIGDVNCDGVVDLLDIQPFVQAISKGEYNFKADANFDRCVDLLDVQVFVNLVVQFSGTTNTNFTGCDINGDGSVDLLDLAAAQNAKIEDCDNCNYVPSADVNRDGKVNQKDVDIIFKKVRG